MDPKENYEISEFEKFLKHRKVRRLPYGIFEKIVILIVAAAGLIAALAWDETLRGAFEYLFGPSDSVRSKFFYAISVTIIAAIVSSLFGRSLAKRKRELDGE